MYVPKIFHYQTVYNHKMVIPSSRPIIQIHVIEKDKKTDDNFYNEVISAAVLSRGVSGSMYVWNGIVLVAKLEMSREKEESGVKYELKQEADVLRPNFPKRHSNFLQTLKSEDLRSLDVLTKSFVGYPSYQEQIQFQIYETTESKEDHGLVHQFSGCHNQLENSRKLNMDLEDVTQKLDHAYAFEWQSIFRNFSYTTDFLQYQDTVCTQGNLRDIDENFSSPFTFSGGLVSASAHFNYPLYLNDTITALRFISCGQRNSMSPLAFLELVSIYDLPFWGYLVCTITLLCVLPTFLGVGSVTSFKTYLSNFETLIRILLGLDVSWKFGEMKMNQVRLMIAGFALTAVVISNGYKSDNMYRIIEPRKIIPTRHFEQLLGDNFTSFTRILYTRVAKTFGLRWSYPFKDWPLNKFYSSPEPTRSAPGYVYLNSPYEVVLNSELYGRSPISGLTALEIVVMNSTYFNPSTKNIVEDAIVWINSSKISPLSYVGKFRDFVLKEDERILYEKFNECKKTAIILPTYKCNELKRNISKSRPNMAHYTDIGDESYFPNFYVFSFQGSVPPYIIMRMKAMQSAGIFEWWQHFLGGSFVTSPLQRRYELKVPNMQGNVPVIFSLYFGGNIFAILACLFECLTRFFSAVILMVNKYVLKLHVAYIMRNLRTIFHDIIILRSQHFKDKSRKTKCKQKRKHVNL